MLLLKKIFLSSIGRKMTSAVTGSLLVVFVFGHLFGNLLVFLGPDAVNSYSEHLHNLGPVLWVVRIILFFSILIHVAVSLYLKYENISARPVRYKKEAVVRATLSARTMVLSGSVIASFIVYHLLHLTFGYFHSEYSQLTDYSGKHDVYSMIVMSFRNPLISLSYITAVTLLSVHLRHAMQSVIQTVGFTGFKIRKYFDAFSVILAVAVFTGFASIPVAVLLKIIKLTGES
jgi:succinate dehydrogenase / fumarate reductase, cytochrome b subunit